ncbi:hypothetical protein LXL04_010587 [Taraxacum kok-saghyz]
MKGMLKEHAVRRLESCGFHAIICLTVLEERSLITIEEYGFLSMHDSIENLGRNIEIEALLSDDEVTEATSTCISVEWLDLSPEIIMKGLGKLKNLKALQIAGRDDDCLGDNWMFDEDNFPNSLRFLKWWSYRGRSLPQTFRENNLVGLELPKSRIMQLWGKWRMRGMCSCMIGHSDFHLFFSSIIILLLSYDRFFDLSHSKLRTLDLGMTPNLARLDLVNCHDLIEIHVPAGCLDNLVIVTEEPLGESPSSVQSFRCSYLEEQSSMLDNSQKSVNINIQNVTKLDFFGLQHLRHLIVVAHIPELPNDLDRLANLEELKLVGTYIKCLPNNIFILKHLKSIILEYYEILEELPRDLGQLVCLEKLTLLSTQIKHLPDSICMMKNLKSLELKDCQYLKELPKDLGRDKYNINRNKPPSSHSLESLRVVGSIEVLQSCDFATEIQNSRGETFCYIQAIDDTENYCNRKRRQKHDIIVSFCQVVGWSVVALLVIQIQGVAQESPGTTLVPPLIIWLAHLKDGEDPSRKPSMASSSTASVLENFKYHVFLSFRGEDTRTNFVDHLYTSLKRLGIHTFRDNEELEKGKRIDELFKAIDESKFFIIVFSKDYASSSWCLMELAKIMNCQDGNKRIAFPLFYYVDPSDIRKQSGPVGRAIARHKTNGQIKKWEKALEDAGNLVGWDIKKIANGHEAEAIDQIVKTISLKLRSVHLRKDENLVGMDSRMKNLESLLRKDLDDEVRMIGIKGMGGIGKTTLARAIFQKISSEFEGASFVDDVREASKERGGLLSLQKQVLKDVLRDDSVSSVQDAISMMEDRMPMKKVLLVLDNVDHIDQLEALAGDWFKGGSRIIVTARDKQVLTTHGMSIILDINLLSEEEALSLFCRYAFKTYIPFEGYGDLSFKVVEYAAGLPLTLKVLGSSLFRKKEPYWIDAIKRLETIPCGETLDKLKISYDSLEDDQKEIFQDVACFMRGVWRKDAIRMLQSRGFHAIAGLTVLEDRSLITISNGKLSMHDSLQELGRIIVRGSPPHELELKNHSRLWNHEEIEALLCDDEVTEATTTCLNVTRLTLNSGILRKGLGKLKNLKLLRISGRGQTFFLENHMSDQGSFPNSLRFLEWKSYPGRFLPQNFQASKLVGLVLPYSKITKLWEGLKVLWNLKFLDLKYSKLRTLDLGMTPNLESLNLYKCHDLTEIHAPTGCLKKLVYLNLLGCSRFRSSLFIKQVESLELLSLAKLWVSVMSFPGYTNDKLLELSSRCFYSEEQVSSLENSQKSVSLDLESATTLESVCGSFFGLQHLRDLTFHGCIPEVPNDLDQLVNLEELKLVGTHIKCLPDSIFMLRHLKSLKLESCQFLEELPRDLGQLVCLDNLTLLSASIKHLPDSICMMKNLKSLELQSCRLLNKLPWDLGQLNYLEKLIVINCESLEDIPNSICNMKCLRYLCLPLCKQVENLPEELGSLEHLKLLDIRSTGINQLPLTIPSLKGLRIVGSVEVLQSCVFATEIQTSSEGETFCYIQAVDNTEKFCNRHEAEAIDQIVKEISLKLCSIDLSNDEQLLGMESRIVDLISCLEIGLDDEVLKIGIMGMGGVGKTTLARAIFHKISSQFEGASFVENVGEASEERLGLMSLQKQVLRDVLGDDSVSSVQDAISMMEDRMPMKKVLLVLDDVDHIDQLQALAGAWFKGGSRIIVTARDKQVLRDYSVNRIYTVYLLSDREAVCFFSRYAFKREIPIEGYEDLSYKIVRYAAGHPLTLKVLGSFLLGKEKAAWENTLKRLKSIPHGEIYEMLLISYDGLEDDHKEIFLEVACFMKGMLKEDAIRMLESCEFDAINGLTVLEERSLITISNQRLEMHDIIQDMGMNIVRRLQLDEPNKQ